MSAVPTAVLSGWSLAVVAALAAVLVVALCAAIVLSMAARLGGQVAEAAAQMRDIRAQPTSPVDGIDMVNESADRILKVDRTLRKAVVDG